MLLRARLGRPPNYRAGILLTFSFQFTTFIILRTARQLPPATKHTSTIVLPKTTRPSSAASTARVCLPLLRGVQAGRCLHLCPRTPVEKNSEGQHHFLWDGASVRALRLLRAAQSLDSALYCISSLVLLPPAIIHADGSYQRGDEDVFRDSAFGKRGFDCGEDVEIKLECGEGSFDVGGGIGR